MGMTAEIGHKDHETVAVNDAINLNDLRGELIGIDAEVPLIDGRRVQYVNFDNAASTPTFRPVAEKVNEFLRWYSNVHRGTGFKSLLSSWVFEEARTRIANFVRADLNEHVVLFTKNSTESINKLANRLNFAPGDIVLTSLMEHHSNELPWRKVAQVEHIAIDDEGRLDAGDFEAKLKLYGDKIRMVAITGASNVSGYITDIDLYARGAHSVGAELLVDAAQLAPHRPLAMGRLAEDTHVDYLVFSAHKMYAPYGIGVLVGKRAPFEEGDPDTVGGGTVDIVNLEEAYWADLPDKEEAGTPDIVGVVALAKVIAMLDAVGWPQIIDHEAELTAYALRHLADNPAVIIHGDADPDRARERLGVISFSVKGVPHSLAAAVLNFEHGIGVRSGCFCAHTYVKCLLHVDDAEAREVEEQILRRDRSRLPGTVRISFGLYNTIGEVDRLVAALQAIGEGRISGDYILDKERGEYAPRGYEVDFEEYFQL